MEMDKEKIKCKIRKLEKKLDKEQIKCKILRLEKMLRDIENKERELKEAPIREFISSISKSDRENISLFIESAELNAAGFWKFLCLISEQSPDVLTTIKNNFFAIKSFNTYVSILNFDTASNRLESFLLFISNLCNDLKEEYASVFQLVDLVDTAVKEFCSIDNDLLLRIANNVKNINDSNIFYVNIDP